MLEEMPEEAKAFLSTPSGWRATVPVCTINTNIFAFLSTPSGWRATPFDNIKHTAVGISIHALRVEGDYPREPMAPRVCDFYPRPPGGGRQGAFEHTGYDDVISIHALRVEGDQKHRWN